MHDFRPSIFFSCSIIEILCGISRGALAVECSQDIIHDLYVVFTPLSQIGSTFTECYTLVAPSSAYTSACSAGGVFDACLSIAFAWRLAESFRPTKKTTPTKTITPTMPAPTYPAGNCFSQSSTWGIFRSLQSLLTACQNRHQRPDKSL